MHIVHQKIQKIKISILVLPVIYCGSDSIGSNRSLRSLCDYIRSYLARLGWLLSSYDLEPTDVLGMPAPR